MSAIQLFDLNGEQRFTGTSVGGGGSQPVIGTSVLVALGAGQLAIGEGFNVAVHYTLGSLIGSDLEVDALDDTHIKVLTDGWYQMTAWVGMNGAAPTSMQVTVVFGAESFDSYVGVDGVNAGGGDLTVTTAVVHLTVGTAIHVNVGSDGTGTWDLETTPNKLTVVRMA